MRGYTGGITEAEVIRYLKDYSGGLRSRSIANLSMSPGREVQKLLRSMEQRGVIEKDHKYIRCREAIWILTNQGNN